MTAIRLPFLFCRCLGMWPAPSPPPSWGGGGGGQVKMMEWLSSQPSPLLQLLPLLLPVWLWTHFTHYGTLLSYCVLWYTHFLFFVQTKWPCLCPTLDKYYCEVTIGDNNLCCRQKIPHLWQLGGRKQDYSVIFSITAVTCNLAYTWILNEKQEVNDVWFLVFLFY